MTSKHETSSQVAVPGGLRGTSSGDMQLNGRMRNQGTTLNSSSQYPSLLGQTGNASSPLKFKAVGASGKLSEKTSWTNGLPGRGTRSTKSSPALSLRSRPVLHNINMVSGTRPSTAASMADSCGQTSKCAFLRLAYSEARRVHQKKTTFKERQVHRAKYCRDQEVPTATVWQLRQCRTTLRDAFQSVLLGVRSALRKLRAIGRHPKQSIAPLNKLFFSSSWELLRKRRLANGLAEVRWQQLWQSIQTPHLRKQLPMLPDEGAKEAPLGTKQS
eukprot:TRINITY_DN98606_c0_g1_i1.p1 TRINITY_DN98606_c0_g1~~TRINITY_DN98606_c0_g1_i1.p1  ORF type:complete len:272 (+),score=41.77 TRINITY_DN98606_c0_g1_i1:67-882(+)